MHEQERRCNALGNNNRAAPHPALSVPQLGVIEGEGGGDALRWGARLGPLRTITLTMCLP